MYFGPVTYTDNYNIRFILGGAELILRKAFQLGGVVSDQVSTKETILEALQDLTK